MFSLSVKKGRARILAIKIKKSATKYKERLPALHAERVNVKLGGKLILENVSFTIERGTLAILLGANGAGKTSLLRTLDGLINPAYGSISLLGRDLSTLNRRELAQLVAYVPQRIQGAFSYSVLQLVVMGCSPYLSPFSIPQRSDYEVAKDALAEVGIAHLSERDFTTLSGGEQQLALLARALTQKAPLMLLDEPTSHLDYANQHHILTTVQSLTRKKGITCLMALHDPNLALQYGDKLLVLNGNRLLGQIDSNNKHFYTEAQKLLQAIYETDLRVYRFQKRPIVVNG